MDFEQPVDPLYRYPFGGFKLLCEQGYAQFFQEPAYIFRGVIRVKRLIALPQRQKLRQTGSIAQGIVFQFIQTHDHSLKITGIVA